jgi:succinate dehydrogenase/fumarate reductase flavoprotein subunit
MRESESQVDLLVIGGGMAGLSAAAYAAHNRARVVLVEKGPVVGGSAAYAPLHTHGADRRGHARGEPRRRPEALDPAGGGL